MKLNWTAELSVTPERTAYNIEQCKKRGLPTLGRPPLAVVGGGPSVVDYISELRNWPGDVWISGSAFQWCLQNGIDGTFFTIDQSPLLANDGRGAKKAILATCCDPAVFDELKDASIQVFDLKHDEKQVNHNATTVTAAPLIGIGIGYRDFTFFGCDSSYTTQTHAYYDEPVRDLMRVKVGERDFLTNPSMLLQAEFLANFFRMVPHMFKVRGDGLLSELVKVGDYDITHGTRDLVERVCGPLKEAA